jgi:CHASE3 domain sensor protein/putative methionine-R-sulfoxide reductase with GAF domain
MKATSNILQLIRKKSIIFSAGLMSVLVIANAGFLIYNNRVLERTTATQVETQQIKTSLSLMWNDVIRNIDLGIRGFAVTQDTSLLLPYNQGISLYAKYQKDLEAKLVSQGYPDMQSLVKVKKGYSDYMAFAAQMVELVKEDNMEQFKEELKLDRGLTLWRIYEKYANEVNAYEDKLYNEATARYEIANKQMSYIQILLAIIGIPTLLFMIIRVVHDERARRELFEELEKNNREYLFNPGTPLDVTNEREMINNSIVNFKKAASFISQISKGNLKVDWEELNEQNKALNEKNLAGELVQMREKMKELKAEDSKRMWATEGLANFSEIIRSHQHDLQALCDESLAYIVKYLSAQQGMLFILRDQESEHYLELMGCYAFNKKKFVEKRIEIGQGLVGQTFLEQQSVMLTEIPQQYITITSGLGDATPRSLLVVPMKYNEKVEAVIEIASFHTYEAYQLEWIEKIGEIMASTLVSLKITERTKYLLEQFKEQTEQLRSQEEELRQNMEEMEATQEEMRRKEQELERRQLEMQLRLDQKK